MTIEEIINEMTDEMDQICLHLGYKYMNLPVKADGILLLSVRIDIQGNEHPIEEVAQVTTPDEYRFEVYPNNATLMPFIMKGIFEYYPIFKQSFRVPEELSISDKSYRTLILTMPDVDDDRYDMLTKTLDTLQKAAKAELEVCRGKAATKLADYLSSFDEEQIEECKQGMKEEFDGYCEYVDKITGKKLEDVEDAHNKYLQEHPVAQETAPQVTNEKGEDILHSFNLNDIEE